MSDGTEEIVTVFVVRCPLGEQCSKRQGILGKRLSEVDARQVIVNHLMNSPYHMLDQEAADTAAENAIVESWDENKEVADESKADEGDGWFNNRKRAKMSKGQMSLAEARDLVRVADGGSGSGASSGNPYAIGQAARSKGMAIAIPVPQQHHVAPPSDEGLCGFFAEGEECCGVGWNAVRPGEPCLLRRSRLHRLLPGRPRELHDGLSRLSCLPRWHRAVA
jgi:hypothetical protein